MSGLRVHTFKNAAEFIAAFGNVQQQDTVAGLVALDNTREHLFNAEQSLQQLIDEQPSRDYQATLAQVQGKYLDIDAGTLDLETLAKLVAEVNRVLAE